MRIHSASSSRRRAGKSSLLLWITVLLGCGLIAVCMWMFLQPGTSSDENTDTRISTEAGQAGAGSGSPQTNPAEADAPALDSAESARSREAVAPQKDHPSIRGLVIFQDGKPAAGARVRAVRTRSLFRELSPDSFTSLETQADPVGRFTLEGLEPGHYALTGSLADSAGMGTALAALDRDIGMAKDRNRALIVLRPASSIQGRVVGPEGTPVEGAWVWASEAPDCLARTDGAGAFSLMPLEIGQYTLLARSEGLFGESPEPILTGETEAEIWLAKGGRILGQAFLDGEPRPGVRITAESVTAITDERGDYVLGPLPAGKVQVEAAADQPLFASRSVEVPNGADLEDVDLLLQRCASVSGKVTSARTGEPLEGVWVGAFPADYSKDLPLERRRARTKTDGRYMLSELPPDAYRLAALPAGPYGFAMANGGAPLDIPEGGAGKEVDFAMEKGASAEIRVHDERGQNLSCVSLSLQFQPGQGASSNPLWLVPEAREREDGIFLIDGLAPGVYRMFASRPGLPDESRTLAVQDASNRATLEIEMARGFEVSGSVQNDEGEAVTGAVVSFRGLGPMGFRQGPKVLTDEEGRFTAPGVTMQDDLVRVLASGYLEYYGRSGSPAQDKDLIVTLRRGGDHYLTGWVADDAGERLSGLSVCFSASFQGARISKTVITKEDGTFQIDGLPDAPGSLSAGYEKGMPAEHDRLYPVDRADIELLVKRYAILRGEVFQEDGAPADFFEMSVQLPGGYAFPSEPFRNGTFVLEKVRPEKVRLLAKTRNGRRAESDWLELAPGEAREGLKLTLYEPGSIAGVVLEKAGGPPISRAKVSAREVAFKGPSGEYGRQARNDVETNPDGTFLFKDLPQGAMTLRAEKEGFIPSEPMELEVAQGQKIEGLEVFLDRGGMIFGTVIKDGLPAPGSNVIAHGQEAGARGFFNGFSGSDGTFCFRGVEPGTYTVQASMPQGTPDSPVPVSRRVQVEKGGSVQCDLVFQAAARLQGRVLCGEKPVPGVYVMLKLEQQAADGATDSVQTSASSQTDALGSFAFSGLAEGTYGLYASSRASGDGCFGFIYSKVIVVQPGLNLHDIRPDQAGTCKVFGTLRKGSQPLPSREIEIRSESVQSLSMITGPDGGFAFRGLEEGVWTLRASMPVKTQVGHTSAALKKVLQLSTGEERQADLSLPPGDGMISGKLSEETNSIMVGGPALFLARLEKSETSFECEAHPFNARCEYRLSGLPPGRYRVMLQEPRRMIWYTEIQDGRETVLDLEFAKGKATLDGQVLGFESKTGEETKVYLFRADACPLQEGKPLDETACSMAFGLITEIHPTSEGAFSFPGLPPGPADLVVLRFEEDKEKKITKLARMRVQLEDDKVIKIELDLR